MAAADNIEENERREFKQNNNKSKQTNRIFRRSE